MEEFELKFYVNLELISLDYKDLLTIIDKAIKTTEKETKMKLNDKQYNLYKLYAIDYLRDSLGII